MIVKELKVNMKLQKLQKMKMSEIFWDTITS